MLGEALAAMANPNEEAPAPGKAPQNMREYDPEWAYAFASGEIARSCDHSTMVSQVRVPVLFTHHFRKVDPATGFLLGAISDQQAGQVRRLIEATGQEFTYQSFPTMPHSMHGADPDLFAKVVVEWAEAL